MMPRLSYWMIAYGILLVAAEATSQIFRLSPVLGHWIPLATLWLGLLMITSALAYAQGRRSLRLGGICVGCMIPLILAFIFSYDAIMLHGSASLPNTIFLSFLALLSIGCILAAYQLRPRDNVASRGYAVTFDRKSPPPAPIADDIPRRSEAG